jgi:hypothetical protein
MSTTTTSSVPRSHQKTSSAWAAAASGSSSRRCARAYVYVSVGGCGGRLLRSALSCCLADRPAPLVAPPALRCVHTRLVCRRCKHPILNRLLTRHHHHHHHHHHRRRCRYRCSAERDQTPDEQRITSGNLEALRAHEQEVVGHVRRSAASRRGRRASMAPFQLASAGGGRVGRTLLLPQARAFCVLEVGDARCEHSLSPADPQDVHAQVSEWCVR